MCNKDDEDDADVDPKYSEEWTQYYALPLILLMEITSVHIGALHVSQTIFFCYLFKGMVVGSTNFLGMGWSHLQGLMARRLPAGSTEH